MPATLMPPMDRRSFLRTGALGAIATLVAHPSRAEGDSLHLAMLSDTHIPADKLPGARGYNAYEQLKSIVPDLIATKADGLVIAGDAAQLTGEREDYVALLEALQPVTEQMPTYIALGNHDDREKFFATVSALSGARQEVEGKHVTVIEHDVVRLILLDSLMYVRQRGGFLGKAQRYWLADYLAKHADRPVALMFHHTLGDGDNDLLDDIRLFQLLEPHKHVRAIFHGHSHRWNTYERQGIPIINLPTSAHIWTPDQPIGWVDAIFRPGGIHLTLHAFAGNTTDTGRTFDFEWR